MKPIRIFTQSIEFLAEISNYESLMLTRSWHGIGDLELRINRHKLYTDTLRKGHVIVVGNDARKAYVIQHREIALDETGKQSENWLIRAQELKVSIAWRQILPPLNAAQDSRSGSAETVMKHYVNRTVINPDDPLRKVSEIALAPDQLRGTHVVWDSRLKTLADDLTEISQLTGVGWLMRLDTDTRKRVFDVALGRNLSVNQAENSPVIFSPQFDNIRNMQYVDSDLNFRNVAYVAGQGEGVDRRIIVVGNASGLDRREIYVDARDVAEETDEETPKPRPEADIIADLVRRGEQKLAELAQESFLGAQIMTDGTFKYEVDYDLGDIVTVQNTDWGVALDARITEVKEIYERDSGAQIEVTFGNSRPTLVTKIKRELAGFTAELTR